MEKSESIEDIRNDESVKIKYSWGRNFFRPLLLLFIFISIYFFAFKGSGSILFHVKLLSAILVFDYFVIMQFEITNLEIAENTLTIRFPGSVLIKNKRYDLENIDQIKINTKPGPYSASKFYVYSEGRKRKFYCSDLELLRQKLVEKGINVTG